MKVSIKITPKNFLEMENKGLADFKIGFKQIWWVAFFEKKRFEIVLMETYEKVINSKSIRFTAKLKDED